MHFTRMRHSTFCATSNIQAKKPIDCQANWPGHSVSIESNVSDQLIYELIDHSYDLVTGALTKKRQKELEEL